MGICMPPRKGSSRCRVGYNVVGEVVVKGVTTIAGTCAEQVEVDADGNVKGLPEPEKEIEGGLIQLEESNGYKHEFLTAMFGGPIPKTAQKYAIADPYTACDELKNGEDMKGKFAIVQRGDCLFANLSQVSSQGFVEI